MDWATFTALFRFDIAPLEIIVRGSCVYWFIFVIFRFVMHRDVGSIGMADVLLLVLIADAAQNAMASEYKTIAEGFLLIATLVFWNWLIDFVAFHVPAFGRFVEPPPLKLIENGRILHRNLRKEYLAVDELMAQLRAKGVERVEDVKVALMEGDGQVSVIPRERRAEHAAAKVKKRVL